MRFRRDIETPCAEGVNLAERLSYEKSSIRTNRRNDECLFDSGHGLQPTHYWCGTRVAWPSRPGPLPTNSEGPKAGAAMFPDGKIAAQKPGVL